MKFIDFVINLATMGPSDKWTIFTSKLKNAFIRVCFLDKLMPVFTLASTQTLRLTFSEDLWYMIVKWQFTIKIYFEEFLTFIFTNFMAISILNKRGSIVDSWDTQKQFPFMPCLNCLFLFFAFCLIHTHELIFRQGQWNNISLILLSGVHDLDNQTF